MPTKLDLSPATSVSLRPGSMMQLQKASDFQVFRFCVSLQGLYLNIKSRAWLPNRPKHIPNRAQLQSQPPITPDDSNRPQIDSKPPPTRQPMTTSMLQEFNGETPLHHNKHSHPIPLNASVEQKHPGYVVPSNQPTFPR